jgi:signal transduction histidine kinase
MEATINSIPDFRTLFESTPALLLVLAPDPAFTIVAVSDAHLRTTMKRREEIVGRGVFDVFPDSPDNLDTGIPSLRASLERVVREKIADTMALIKYDIERPQSAGGGFEERYWSVVNSPVIQNGNLEFIINRPEDVTEFVRLKRTDEERNQLDKQERGHLQKMEIDLYQRAREIQQANEQLRLAQNSIKELNATLQRQNTQLEAANKELESFSYSVSHDLRAPLRAIDGFSLAILEDYSDKLDADGKDHLQRVRSASQRMGILIDDMLNLSRISRMELSRQRVNLSEIATEIAAELRESAPDRSVEFIIAPNLFAEVDPRLLRIMLTNLLGNAWKFTTKREGARIEFGSSTEVLSQAYFIRDNGAGFDMTYANKLFGAFQRLHSTTDFPGTGIGLAIVQRIISRHGGQIWADAKINAGATFYFVL